ncbi:MAG TPA: NADH-quinone oxidoreductase subunit NuoN [Actinomycetota bacterium]|jgi:NADH-quinone oxidoreductase subunit N|nr:NADH-quinone oxidoreductase subunit NuoN [Actinomycetota bacterium]
MVPVSPPDIDLLPIAPEMALAGAAILVLLLDAWRPARNQRLAVGLTLVGLIGAAAASVALWRWTGPSTVLGGMVAVDGFSVFFRLLIAGSAAIAVLFSATYLKRTGEARGEYYALLLFAASGMSLLSAAADLIVVFLSLEVLSLSLYVMAGFSRRRLASQEAGMKYFLLGAFSSAFFLYGIALAYGATGTTNIREIASALGGGGGGSTALALAGAALLAVGFGFKVAAVPFHMWTPDVYQGAPTPVTAFMAAGTKVAGFAALLRVTITGLQPVVQDLTPALWAVSALTMIVGSVLAIAQTDVKRMLAYSSIAHAGFVLVGVVAYNALGEAGAMFYLAAYAAMILGAFGVVALVSRRGEEHTSLVSYEGLYRRSPVLAALLALFLLSLAGIPPTAGFVAKVLVFQAAVVSGHWALVVVAVLASVVAAFFYIRVIVIMYMQEPEEAGEIRAPGVPSAGLAVAAAATLLLGVFPSLLLDPWIGRALIAP